VLFYMAAQEELEPYHPVPKFLAIKAVIFFTFWCASALAPVSVPV
jgi:CRISPR/Cas system CMR subunit Cmr6 (Cas7 group RAMP superfamily)